LQLFLGVGCPAEIQEVKLETIETVETEKIMSEINSISIECKTGPKMRKFLNKLDKEFDVASSEKLCWKKYIAENCGDWNKLLTISPGFNVNKIPSEATSIIASPKKIFRYGFISCFYLALKNSLDDEWYVVEWYIVPTKQAKKLSKVLYKSWYKKNDSEKVRLKKTKKLLELDSKFETVFVNENSSWFKAD
jgi:hypothetical protein